MTIHPLPPSAQGIEAPALFPNPFYCQPHPLVCAAASQVRLYLATQPQFAAELSAGKMMGVLVVRQGERQGESQGERQGERLGFLAAFSGTLGGRMSHPYFVPPIYDSTAPESYFQQEQAAISRLNDRLGDCRAAIPAFQCPAQAEAAIAAAKEALAKGKAQRKALREEFQNGQLSVGPSPTKSRESEIEQSLQRESQFQRAEFRRLKQHWAERVAQEQAPYAALLNEIQALETERRERSQALQAWLFDQYLLRNARGETMPMTALFSPNRETSDAVGTHGNASSINQGIISSAASASGGRIAMRPYKWQSFLPSLGNSTATPFLPPSGAGDCCGPKLLQAAYALGVSPLCMGEFWVGRPPVGILRREGCFYTACRSRCLPILTFMMQGLHIDHSAQTQLAAADIGQVEEIFHNADMAVLLKPAGLLSAPGKAPSPSLMDYMHKHFPAATGPMIVHRLDMATSGLIAVALNANSHRQLQQAFASRQVHKYYLAILEKPMRAGASGTISLPLCPDIDDRPRQKVDDVQGKEAITHYHVLGNITDDFSPNDQIGKGWEKSLEEAAYVETLCKREQTELAQVCQTQPKLAVEQPQTVGGSAATDRSGGWTTAHKPSLGEAACVETLCKREQTELARVCQTQPKLAVEQPQTVGGSAATDRSGGWTTAHKPSLGEAACVEPQTVGGSAATDRSGGWTTAHKPSLGEAAQHQREQQKTQHPLLSSHSHAVLLLEPHTGRTHQLRVHCAHQRGLHNPILGDTLYGSNDTLYGSNDTLYGSNDTLYGNLTGQRLMLHAAVLAIQGRTFYHLDGLGTAIAQLAKDFFKNDIQ